jgi:hypothetical protein
MPLFGVIGKDNEIFYAGNYRSKAIPALQAAIASFDSK